MSGKGPNGYNVVNWQLKEYEYASGIIQLGWSGECVNPGIEKCRPPVNVIDPNDELHANALVSIAETKAAGGQSTGNETILVQVSGESFKRKYTVTWSLTTGLTGSIVVDRVDV